MRRREFIGIFFGTAFAWPFSASAQQKLPTIGWLGSGSSIAARMGFCFHSAAARTRAFRRFWH
jgi:hypothetical protein